jgi:hypothetical protein
MSPRESTIVVFESVLSPEADRFPAERWARYQNGATVAALRESGADPCSCRRDARGSCHAGATRPRPQTCDQEKCRRGSMAFRATTAIAVARIGRKLRVCSTRPPTARDERPHPSQRHRPADRARARGRPRRRRGVCLFSSRPHPRPPLPLRESDPPAAIRDPRPTLRLDPARN